MASSFSISALVPKEESPCPACACLMSSFLDQPPVLSQNRHHLNNLIPARLLVATARVLFSAPAHLCECGHVSGWTMAVSPVGPFLAHQARMTGHICNVYVGGCACLCVSVYVCVRNRGKQSSRGNNHTQESVKSPSALRRIEVFQK